jgi:aminoglycoside phosphotransferase (APT) family kinase protein
VSSVSDLEPGLRRFLAERLNDENLRITDLRRHIEGFSWETWELTAQWHAERDMRRRLIARRVPAAGLVPPYDVPGQWALARALKPVPGIPVAEPLWADPEGTATGRPLYVMEHVDGDVPVPWNTHTYFTDDAARQNVGHQLMDILAAIHTIDLDTLPKGLRGLDDPDPAAEVRYWEAIYERVSQAPVPALERAFGWLGARASDVSGRRSLVHGDFRIGNAIVRDGDVVAMLDWELAHVGDPVEDLANFCMRLYRGKLKIPSGVLTLEQVIAAYAAAAGWEATGRQLTYWLVFNDVRSAVTFLVAADLFASGATRDLRYAAFSYQTPYLLRHVMADLPSDV